MNGKQHLAIGCAVSVGIAAYSVKNGDVNMIPAILTAPFGAMLPDIDHDMTKLGRTRKKATSALKVISILAGLCAVGFGFYMMIALGDITKAIIYLLGLFIPATLVLLLLKVPRVKSFMGFAGKHRGIMHTLLVPLLLSLPLITGSTNSIFTALLLGIAFGYVSHLFADMCTIEGTPILWPLTRKCVNVLKLPSDSPILDVLVVIIGGGIIWLCLMI